MTNTMRDAREIPPIKLDPEDIELLTKDPAYVAEMYWLPDDVHQYLKRETGWVLSPDSPPIPLPDDENQELWQRVGLRQLVCPACKDFDLVERLTVGVETGIRVLRNYDCPCTLYRRFQDKIMSQIPNYYRDVTLDTLSPRENPFISVARQAEIFALVKANPEDSYLFIGPPRIGKTHTAFALFRAAGWRWAQRSWAGGGPLCPVWRYRTNELLNAILDYELNRDRKQPPSLTVSSLKMVIHGGGTPFLMLDDLHALKFNETKIALLQTLIDICQEAGGQVISTSNEPPDYFTHAWGKSFGEAIIGRIASGPGKHLVAFADRVAADS